MDTLYDDFAPLRERERGRPRRPKYGSRIALQPESFVCIHCRAPVLTLPQLSGVNNRNHCPYCLWSRHLDHAVAGDRLSACKGAMRPVGVALKHSPKKYGDPHGELMLAHCCTECGRLWLNRIAADDDPQAIWNVFAGSSCAAAEHPALLGPQQAAVVRHRLFGK